MSASDPNRGSLEPVIDALSSRNPQDCPLGNTAHDAPLPSADRIGEAASLLKAALFPEFFGIGNYPERTLREHVAVSLTAAMKILELEILRSFAYAQETGLAANDMAPQEFADQISAAFANALPSIRTALELDARALYEGDPASVSALEPVFSYPGFIAVLHYRLAHELHRLNVPLLPRIITEQAHSTTGIDIHPGAQIGERFFIDHGTGVVIGETTIIGDRVKLYQGVTLGAKSFPLDAAGNPVKGVARHPIVEDGVTIYAGATVLGRVRIGAGSIIGGNVWITRDVPAGSRIYQVSARDEQFDAGSGI